VLEPGSVLLVYESGMVDSASLARLIDHADRAEEIRLDDFLDAPGGTQCEPPRLHCF
jgi:hypothetical protein